MVQIAVKLKNDMVDDVIFTNPDDYKEKDGWIHVESDPAFLLSERYSWTVRQLDNKLVHSSTGMTPEEESTQANALLGKQVGQALIASNTASDTATEAKTLASGAVASLAKLGQEIAPILAAAQQSSNNTTTGGTN